jgi:hypothetical protein
VSDSWLRVCWSRRILKHKSDARLRVTVVCTKPNPPMKRRSGILWLLDARRLGWIYPQHTPRYAQSVFQLKGDHRSEAEGKRSIVANARYGRVGLVGVKATAPLLSSKCLEYMSRSPLCAIPNQGVGLPFWVRTLLDAQGLEKKASEHRSGETRSLRYLLGQSRTPRRGRWRYLLLCAAIAFRRGGSTPPRALVESNLVGVIITQKCFRYTRRDGLHAHPACHTAGPLRLRLG